MYTKCTYNTKQMALWTRYETMLFTAISIVWISAFFFVDLDWLRIPWTPLALIGTAVAFVIGFQNNASYGRIWESRKIWGGIVNTSRTFGAFVQDMIINEHTLQKMSEEELNSEMKTLTYWHIAWMTALRHAMRVLKPWETTSSQRTNSEWGLKPPERKSTLEEDIKPYLSAGDIDYISNKDNKQTALLYLQSHHLRALKEQGIIWEFSFLELEAQIKELFSLQGKSEPPAVWSVPKDHFKHFYDFRSL